MLNCALCLEKECYNGKDCLKLKEEIKKLYQKNEISLIKTATSIETKYYMKKTRIEEIILFSKRMDYKIRTGFLLGLKKKPGKSILYLKNISRYIQPAAKSAGLIKPSLN